jgi:phosphoglycerate dehydrogenase-like enzyme
MNYMGQGLTGRTLGLVGAGGIGQEILKLARPFFARMLVADPYAEVEAVRALGAEVGPLDAVMREADFVVVCCLLNDETRHLIDAEKLALMKPTAYYINVGRGSDPRRAGARRRGPGGPHRGCRPRRHRAGASRA